MLASNSLVDLAYVNTVKRRKLEHRFFETLIEIKLEHTGFREYDLFLIYSNNCL